MIQKDKKDPRTYAIIGAAIEVHRQLGSWFLEAVYHEAMALELAARGVAYRREAELPVLFKGQRLSVVYRADFICFDVIVELKALPHLSGKEEAQMINYLKATGHEIGLLLNFGAESLEHRRIVFSSVKSAESADWVSLLRPEKLGIVIHLLS